VLRYDSEALAHRLQRTIEQIKGITSARVILDDKGAISEIHLVGSAGRKAKQIVRDTESLLYARFGIRIDYRRISLVQLDAPNVSLVPSRLIFVSASASPQAENCVRVVLQSDGRTYEGVASVFTEAHQDAQANATAQATIGAVQQAIGEMARLAVQEAKHVSANGQNVSLVVIHALTSQGEECLTGTCLVRDQPLDAVAKATLDAINRRLPVWFRASNGNRATFSMGSQVKAPRID
jgi:hypothetical protein